MSFSRKTLSDFLTNIFIIGLGNELKKSLDGEKVVDNFEEWIIEQKPNLVKNKKSIAEVVFHVRGILVPMVCGDEDKIGLQDYIKEKFIQNYPAEINLENLRQFTEQATISLAIKIYKFFELLAQELELDSELNNSDSGTDSEWEEDLLDEVSFPKRKASREKIDFNQVLKEVFYKEIEPYLFQYLKDYVPPREYTLGSSRIEAVSFAQARFIKSCQNLTRPHELLSDGEGEFKVERVCARKTRKVLSEPLFAAQHSEGLRENIPLKWRILIAVSTLVGALFSPLSSVLGLVLWDLVKNKKKNKKAENAQELKSELFKVRKPKRQHLIRPRELLSDSEENYFK